VSRPAIAAPLPVPGETPTVLLDAGANAECQPEWLVQFAQMGTVFSRQRFGLASPRVGLLSIGEEASKGSSFVKEVHHLLDGAPGVNFIGNIEGHDVATDLVDVVVTDGFSGNVVLKTLEGGLEVIVGVIRAGLASTAETRAAADVLAPVLEPLFDYMGPEATGGAVLLGVEGVCIISHGRSSARAVTNAIALAAEMVRGDIVGGLRSAIATPG
jgi:glycerol-3-phosphate acyltransferase PlsX